MVVSKQGEETSDATSQIVSETTGERQLSRSPSKQTVYAPKITLRGFGASMRSSIEASAINTPMVRPLQNKNDYLTPMNIESKLKYDINRIFDPEEARLTSRNQKALGTFTMKNTEPGS